MVDIALRAAAALAAEASVEVLDLRTRLAARRRRDPRVARAHLARVRAAGGELVARRRRRRALADRARGLRAARRPARARGSADRAGAVRARARGRLHPVRRPCRRGAAEARCLLIAPPAWRAPLRRRGRRHARRPARALPAGAPAPPDRGARRAALPPGPDLRLGLHRSRPGGRGAQRPATRSAPTTCARRSTASWHATSRAA